MSNEQKEHDEKKKLLKTDSKPLKKGQKLLTEEK